MAQPWHNREDHQWLEHHREDGVRNAQDQGPGDEEDVEAARGGWSIVMKHKTDDDKSACIHGYGGTYERKLVAYVVPVDKVLVDGIDKAQQQDDLDN